MKVIGVEKFYDAFDRAHKECFGGMNYIPVYRVQELIDDNTIDIAMIKEVVDMKFKDLLKKDNEELKEAADLVRKNQEKKKDKK